jgi:mycofactocin system transcriptional regulator
VTIEMGDAEVTRRGRRPSTSARALEVIALRLFTERGFQATTIDDIASAAQISRTTFFRYFESKSDVLWREFDEEVAALRHQLTESSDAVPTMDAIREALIAANHLRAEDVPDLRARVNLIASVPELAASASVHYEALERAISEFVASRCGQAADALVPLAIGRATLAVCRAAYDRWAASPDADLGVYLDVVLRDLADGFAAAVRS